MVQEAMIDTHVAGKPEFPVRRQAALSATTIGRTFGPNDTYIIIALVLVGVIAPVAAAVCLHSFGIPQNDDWAYRITLFRSVATGHLSFVRWGSMTLVGQILWAAPFVLFLGPHLWVAGVAVAVLACLGLAAAYLLARSILPAGWSAFCVGLVMAAPGFLLNSTSFMTDVPAFSAEMICLYLGLLALRSCGRSRGIFLTGAMLVGSYGFSIRQFAIAAPIAVLICLALQDRRHPARYAIVGGGTAAICTAIYFVCIYLGSVTSGLALPTKGSFYDFAAMYFTLSFVLSPLLPRLIRGTVRSFSWPAGLAGTVALALGLELWHWWGDVFAGNYLFQQGALGAEPDLGPGRPDLFPGMLWMSFNLIALLGGVCLAASAGAALKPVLQSLHSAKSTREQLAAVQARLNWFGANGHGLLVLFAVITALGLGAYTLFSTKPAYDRYLYPIVLPLAVLLVGSARHLRSGGTIRLRERLIALAVAGLGSLVALAAVAVTLNADSQDAALWAAGQSAVRAGSSPSSVDAGFAWRGYYQDVQGSSSDLGEYCAFVSNSSAAVAVEIGELLNFGSVPPVHLVQTVTYDELGFAVPEHLYVYARHGAKCGV